MEATRERLSHDKVLLFLVVFMLGLGTVAVLDASFARAMQSRSFGFDQYYFFKKQAMNAVLAGVVLLIAMNAAAASKPTKHLSAQAITRKAN